MIHVANYNPQARSLRSVVQTAALAALSVLGCGCDDKQIERVTYDKPPPDSAQKFTVPEGNLDAGIEGRGKIASPQTVTGGEPLVFEGSIALGSVSAPPSVAVLSITQPGRDGEPIVQQGATAGTEAAGRGRVKYVLQAKAPTAPGRYHVTISYLVAGTDGKSENRVVAEGDIDIAP